MHENDLKCSFANPSKIVGYGYYDEHGNPHKIELQREVVNPWPNEVLDASAIPADRMKLMQAKYSEFKKKWPKMKDQRVVRKVAEYFKIKLV